MFERRWLVAGIVVVVFASAVAMAESDDSTSRLAEGSTGFDVFPELDLRFGMAWASNSVFDDGSGNDVVEYVGEGSLDLRLRRSLGGGKFFEMAVGFGASELRQNEGSDVEPSTHAVRVTADWDAIRSRAGKRLTVGLLFEDASTDFGRLNFGDRRRYVVAAMFTGKAKGECELGTTVLFWENEDFDDTQNAGDPAFDRSDDGNFESYGIEQTWVIGTVPDGETCYRSGLWRRLIFYRNPYVRGGYSYRREPTRGTLFDAKLHTVYINGHMPVYRQGKIAFEGQVAWTRIDYTQLREDDVFAGDVGIRWLPRIRPNDWVRQFDFRVSLFGTFRGSNVPGFDYDRWGLFAGFGLLFGPTPGGGPGTTGSSHVDRRDTPGGSEPVVQSDVDP